LVSNDFKRILRSGKRRASAHFTACMVPAAADRPGTSASGVLADCGVAIPKKFLRSAVLRNAVKRQVREAYRLCARNLAARVVFLGKARFDVGPRGAAELKRAVRAESEDLLKRLGECNS
jgi:ribonuclease P protein component